MKDFKKAVIIGAVLGLLVTSGAMAAQKDKTSGSTAAASSSVSQTKTMGGTVVFLRTQSKPKTIGITYAGDNADYYFMLSDDVKVVHKNSIDDIKPGDTVEITFLETKNKQKNGEEMTDRQAKIVKFIHAAKSDGTLSSQ